MRVILLLLFILPHLAFAGDSKSPKEQAEAFLSLIKAGDIPSAYKQLIEDKPAEEVEAYTTQTEGLLTNYGEITGIDLAKEKEHGPSLVELVYILKTPSAPIIWKFFFYKPEDSWKHQAFSFSDQLAALQ